MKCPNCGSTNIHKRGFQYSKKDGKCVQWWCKDCYTTTKYPVKDTPEIKEN